MADQTYLSKQKAARRLDVSEKTIDRLRSSGALEWIKVGSRVRIPVSSLDAFEQDQLEQRRLPAREDDFEALFPIPALDDIRARKAAGRAASTPASGEAA